MAVQNRYQIPLMGEFLDSLGELVLFSSLDCIWAHLQILVHPDNMAKITFTSHFRSFMKKRLPLGLRNAPGKFQHAVDVVYLPVKWQFSVVDSGEIIALYRYFEDHFWNLTRMMPLMGDAGFPLNNEKKFFSC